MSAATLGRRLRTARRVRGLSLRALHTATATNGSRPLAVSHLQRLEAGDVRNPTPDTLRRLAAALELDYSDLLRAAGY